MPRASARGGAGTAKGRLPRRTDPADDEDDEDVVLPVKPVRKLGPGADMAAAAGAGTAVAGRKRARFEDGAGHDGAGYGDDDGDGEAEEAKAVATAAAKRSKKESQDAAVDERVYSLLFETSLTSSELIGKMGMAPAAVEASIERLVKAGRAESVVVSGRGVFRGVAPDRAVKLRGLDTDDLAVLHAVEKSGASGAWLRTIRNHAPTKKPVEKIVRSLIKRNLIKPFHTLAHRSRKMFIAFDIQPSAEESGGIWYVEATMELDTHAIAVARTMLLRVLWYNFPGGATARDLLAWCNQESLFAMKATTTDVMRVMESLVCDGYVTLAGYDYDYAALVTRWDAYSYAMEADILKDRLPRGRGGAAKPSDIESDYHDDSAGGGSRAAAPSLTRLIDESRRARRPHGPPPGALGYEELAALQKLDPTVWPTPDSAGAGSSEGTAAATAAVSHATGSTVVNGGVGPGAAEALRRLWGGDDDGGDGDEEAADAEPVYVPTDFRRPRPVVPDPSAGVEAMGTYAPTADTLTTVPCGTCRVRSQCRPGGVVSPETCVYISHWLQW